jgi:hypothetical protein
VYLEQKGWEKEKIAEITDSPEYQLRLAAMEMGANAARTGGDGTTTPPGRNRKDQQQGEQQQGQP